MNDHAYYYFFLFWAGGVGVGLLQQVANHRTRGCDWLCVLAQRKLRLIDLHTRCVLNHLINSHRLVGSFVRSVNTQHCSGAFVSAL